MAAKPELVPVANGETGEPALIQTSVSIQRLKTKAAAPTAPKSEPALAGNGELGEAAMKPGTVRMEKKKRVSAAIMAMARKLEPVPEPLGETGVPVWIRTSALTAQKRHKTVPVALKPEPAVADNGETGETACAQKGAARP